MSTAKLPPKWFCLGVYYNEKRFEDYQRLTSGLIEQFPTNPVFVMWLADFHIRQGRLDEGNQKLTLLLDKGKTAARSKLSLAQIHYEKGRVLLEKTKCGRCRDQSHSCH